MRKILYLLLTILMVNCSKDDDSSGSCLVCDYAQSTDLITGETELLPWDEITSKICAGVELFGGINYSKAMLQALLLDPETSCEDCNCRLE